MRSPTKTDNRRPIEARGNDEHERTAAEEGDLAESMIDALSDILQWERASERALRIAEQTSSGDVTKN
jgi:hypothetical protein